MNKGKKLVVQMAYCCGEKFRRSRFLDKHFPGTHHRKCFKCGALLRYAVVNPKVAKRKRREECALRNRLAGLTAHGTLPRRAPVSPEQRRKLRSEYAQRVRDERAAQGLNTRGTQRVYRPRRNRVEVDYAVFRESLDIHTPDFFNSLQRGEEAA